LKRFKREWGDYIHVYENCPFRGGWIIVLQVPKSEWNDTKYDKYR
jgi:hypothetical protein